MIVTLNLPDDDSAKLLARALDNFGAFHGHAAASARAQVAANLKDGNASEAQRNERRAAEFDRRAVLVQAIADQLPVKLSPLPAPMGTAR